MEDKKDSLKVLRVTLDFHITAKVNAAKKGKKLQDYIQELIQADEQGRVNWEE